MNNYWSLRIANEFIEKSLKDKKPITQLKLQKLCYFANGEHWKSFDEQLIEDYVEAWKYGPVYRGLRDFMPYQASKEFTRKISNEEVKIIIQNENRVYKEMDEEIEDGVINILIEELNENLDYKAIKTIDKVWEKHKGTTAYELTKLTNKKDGPWDLVYEKDRFNKIPQTLIKDAFTNSNPL